LLYKRGRGLVLPGVFAALIFSPSTARPAGAAPVVPAPPL